MRTHRSTGAGTIAALTLCCVFGATMLLSLSAGALVYRNVNDRVESAAVRRVGLTYITAKLRGSDGAGLVQTGTFGGEDALFLLEEMDDGTVYETILYVYDGTLRELLCEQGWELEPEDGQVITQARELRVETEGQLLRLTVVDANGVRETAQLYLRSGG